jgi:hypothetical protein
LSSECVSSILSKKLSPGEKPTDQDLAIAHSECRDKTASMALQNIKIKLANLKISQLKPRYLTASLDSEFIPNPDKQGKFASYFLLKGDEVNGREWGVTSSSIPQNISSFIGMPLVATGEKFVKDSPYGQQYLHPSISHFAQEQPELVAGLNPMDLNDIRTFQDRFKIGTIDDVFFNPNKGLWNASVKLAEGVEASDLPPFCSPALYQLDMTEHEGSITKWTGLHLAALDQRPAYGNIALLNATCSGTSKQCKMNFASQENPLKTDLMKLAAQLSTDNTETDVVCLAGKPCKKEASGHKKKKK